jgi:hypothetical protein
MPFSNLLLSPYEPHNNSSDREQRSAQILAADLSAAVKNHPPTLPHLRAVYTTLRPFPSFQSPVLHQVAAM